MNSQKNPFTILIEGNIGAGKSTMLKYFEQFEYIEIVAEPIAKWQNLDGSNLLDLLYKDAQKWGFQFQTYNLLLMLQNHMKSTVKQVKLMERSIFSALYCFNEILIEQNSIRREEYDILRKWNEYIIQSFSVQPDLIVYLRTRPEEVFERIKQRKRQEEYNINLKYLERLHELHEDWLVHNEHNSSIPILILDANLNENDVRQEYEKVCEKFLR